MESFRESPDLLQHMTTQIAPSLLIGRLYVYMCIPDMYVYGCTYIIVCVYVHMGVYVCYIPDIYIHMYEYAYKHYCMYINVIVCVFREWSGCVPDGAAARHLRGHLPSGVSLRLQLWGQLVCQTVI